MGPFLSPPGEVFFVSDPAAPFGEVQGLILAGRRDAAAGVLRRALGEGCAEPDRLARGALLFSQMAAHGDALACHRALVRLLPGRPEALRGLAAAETACGLLEEAETHLDQAIGADPAEPDGWYNRSVLRRQRPARNHVAALRARIATAKGADLIPLAYALAKELEDLGEDGESFTWLTRGAAARRERLSYRVETDVAAMERIPQVFSAEKLATPAPGASAARPIFIVGLPRTGTTLLEQMLGMHPQVAALGELTELPMAVMRAAGGANKGETIARAGEADFAAFGADYVRAVAAHGPPRPVTVDKLPSNFLYLGMLRLGLPGARILHLRRSPMDSAYAIYKTLFRMGYPYSYSLTDLAQYYVAYHRLMDHWRAAAPGLMVDIDYEALVGAPETTLRAVLERIDLAWDDSCLRFHDAAGPVATASAAQVREPVHARSVGLWRRHTEGLAPFFAGVKDAGIDPLSGLAERP